MERSPRPPEPCDLLITGAHVLSLDAERRVYPRGAIAVRGRDIVAVGPERLVGPAYAPQRTIDAGGGIVHPGFVDTHVHFMNTARGSYPDTTPLGPGMSVNRRWWAAAEDEDEYASVLLTGSEMLSNGTTCFMEAGTIHEPAALEAAARELGLRGLVADPFLWDAGEEAPEDRSPRAPRSTKRALGLLGGQLARNADPDALVRGYVAIFGYGTATDELMLAAKAAADAGGVALTQHQSYGPSDIEADGRGALPLLYLEELGVLGPNCTYSHMNHLAPEERDAVLRHGVNVAWCPSCSLAWATGAAQTSPHAELHRRGGTVALAADGATSSCRYDIGLQGLLALLTTRDRTRDRESLRAEDVLEMATIGGARAAGLDHLIGSLEPGKRADLVIRADDLPETHPDADPIQALVYAAGSKSVDTVIVDGCVVFADGHVTGPDPADVHRLADASAARMRARLGLATAARWPEVV